MKLARYEAELEVPPMPLSLGYLMEAFNRLRRRQPGDRPLGWTDIDAFCRRAGLRLAPWEVELVERLDDAWLQSTR